VLDVAIEALPAIEDDLGANVIEQMAVTITDLREELAAVRATLSAALTHAQTQHVEIARLRDQHHRLIDEYGALRVKILRQAEAA
jgi:hypothetical protein